MRANRSYQLTIGQRWLAGNFYFLHRRIFIFCFPEPLSINIEEYKGLVYCTRLFIQICFGVVWVQNYSFIV